MTLHVFLFGLFIVSTLTSLFTEGIKKTLQEQQKPYHANALAGHVAIVLSFLVSIGYMVLTEATFGVQAIVYIIALMLLSWLCAMIGYDKVMQAIAQFKGNK